MTATAGPATAETLAATSAMTSGLPTIGLPELLGLAGLQTRVDRKYLVPVSTLAALPAADPAMRVLEIDGVVSHAYASRYEDTATRESYLLAAHGRPSRYKVRTRTYCDSGLEVLEVKTRSRRGQTVKDRLPLEEASRFDVREFVPSTIRERTGIPFRGALAPVLDVHYDRTTCYLPGSGARATVDTGLAWTDLRTGRRLGLSGVAIVETKSLGAPSPLDRLLWRMGHRPVRLSKFACGLALTAAAEATGDVVPPGAEPAGLPANRWHRTLTRLAPHTVPC